MTHLGAHLSLLLLIRRQNPLTCLLRHMFNAISVAVSTILLSFTVLMLITVPSSQDEVLGMSFGLIFFGLVIRHYDDANNGRWGGVRCGGGGF